MESGFRELTLTVFVHSPRPELSVSVRATRFGDFRRYYAIGCRKNAFRRVRFFLQLWVREENGIDGSINVVETSFCRKCGISVPDGWLIWTTNIGNIRKHRRRNTKPANASDWAYFVKFV